MSNSMPFYACIFIFLTLVSACDNKKNQAIKQWEHAVRGSYAADISDDASLALISSIHHGISLWDLKKEKTIYQWQHNKQELHQVFLAKIAPLNKWAITAGRHDFVIWNLSTGKAKGYWKVEQSPIRDIALSANGEQVLAGLVDGKVLHINVATGRRLEFLGHSEKINSVALSSNGRYALSGSNDFQALLWDTQTAQIIHRFVHQSRVTMVAMEKDGRFAFTAGSKKQTVIWDLATGNKLSQLHYPSRQQIYSSVNFAKDGQWLITGSPSRTLTLWDVPSGQAIQKWKVTPRKNTRPEGAVVYDAQLYNQDTIISSSSSGLTELWQIKRQIKRQIKQQNKQIN